jgi:hypothetical protein
MQGLPLPPFSQSLPAVVALSVSHRASDVQKKFRGSLVICLSAVVEDPFDIFFFSFLE